jgi:nucleoside-diphosphate-sugar epimerase
MQGDAQHYFSGKSVVVFGAGYVGGAVVEKALSYGAKVTALTRNPSTAVALLKVGARVVCSDLSLADWRAEIPGEAEYVLNCVSAGGGGPQGYRRSYLLGMESVLAWAGQRAVQSLTYTSSTSVYAQGGGQRVDETSEAGGGESEETSILFETEQRVLQTSAAGRRRVILRLAGIYGPGRHMLLDQLRAGATQLPGFAAHHLNLVHRDDIVEAVFAVWRSGVGEGGRVYNVADDGEATRGEIVEWLCEKLGRTVPVFNAQTTAGRRRATPDRVISNARLKAESEWRPRYPSFREGYAHCF